LTPPGPADDAPVADRPIHLQFDDNALLPLLFGRFDQHLARIEQTLGVSLASRGNRVVVDGPAHAAAQARDALNALYDRLKRGLPVDIGEVDAAVRLAGAGAGGPGIDRNNDGELVIRTPRRHITPRTPGQQVYLRALADNELVFGLGPAGTGKTYLAVATAVAMMNSGRVDRLILSRPAVEAGERLGFLPGDMKEKVDPYLRPIYDALYDTLPAEQVERRIASGEIEIAPLAFMRGRTLANAFIVLDEAQNTTIAQMKMFLTRFGEGSRMVICGDPRQVDLPLPGASGLADAVARLDGVEGIAMVPFGIGDVVRHPVVGRIVQAYEGPDA